MAPQRGKVRSQASTIRLVTPQRTAENRRVAPTPMMAVLIVWVVLTGTPKKEARVMAKPAELSAAKPWTGSSFVIWKPMVRIMRQPPSMVPNPMTAPQRRMTHRGI